MEGGGGTAQGCKAVGPCKMAKELHTQCVQAICQVCVIASMCFVLPVVAQSGCTSLIRHYTSNTPFPFCMHGVKEIEPRGRYDGLLPLPLRLQNTLHLQLQHTLPSKSSAVCEKGSASSADVSEAGQQRLYQLPSWAHLLPNQPAVYACLCFHPITALLADPLAGSSASGVVAVTPGHAAK